MIKVENVTAHDGYSITTRISQPDNSIIEKIVIYINGSGANTYENKRRWTDGTAFKYHDFFVNEFCNMNIAYCSYNTRGVDLGESEPFFTTINDSDFRKYLPSNSVKDVLAIIKHLKNKECFKNAKIYLLGWSEGTIIAPLVALNYPNIIDGLFLAGYDNDNLKDTLIWQMNGNSEYTAWQKLFDYDKKGYISKEDFEEDKYKVRTQLFGDLKFEDLDKNCNGKLDVDDAAQRSLPHLNNMLCAIENDDDEWFKNNHSIRLTSGWFKEHFELKPTKEVLPLLDLPIYIFQGENDVMCPKFYAEDIERTFKELGKNNLTVKIFTDHDHDLNYLLYIIKKEISEGIKCIFDTIQNL